MGEIINLRQARKARERAAKEARAEQNRAKHGRTKADRRIAELARQKHDATLDGARRERPGSPWPNGPGSQSGS